MCVERILITLPFSACLRNFELAGAQDAIRVIVLIGAVCSEVVLAAAF